MATFFTDDFADFTSCSGENCGDWTIRYRTDLTWTPASDVTIAAAASSDWSALTWDDVDADADRDDVEILAIYNTGGSTANGLYPFVVRASGEDESATNYSVVIRTAATTTIRIAYCSGSDTPTNVASVSKALSINTDYWVRFRVNGSGPTTVKLKVWSGAIGDEPTTGGAGDGWDISTTDTSGPTAAGWVGLSSYSTERDEIVKQFGVGTNGDTAPSVASGGATDLTPSLYSNSQTFHAPTVAAGSVTLTPALFANSQTFHAATVSQSGAPQSLTPSLYANSATFYAPAVTRGSVTLAPALVVNSQTFHAATVTRGSVTLSPSLFANSSTFHSASVSIEGGPQYLVPSLVANSSTFHAATVTRGAVTLTPALFANAATFHAATVTNGLSLAPPLVASINQFFTAVVTTGGVTVTPGLFANSATFYTATVANAGVQTLAPDLLTNGNIFYVPTVTGGARTIAAARSTGRNLATTGRSNAY